MGHPMSAKLTAAKVETGARWSEIDLVAKLWIVPAERMKAGKAHRVPLSDRAVAILGEMKELRTRETDDALVFPGRSSSGGLSDMAFRALMRRMKKGDLTIHGIRSTFRDWAGEAASYPREIAEQALAHAVGSDVERRLPSGRCTGEAAQAHGRLVAVPGSEGRRQRI